VVKIPKYPKSVLKRSRNPVFGAAGIGILAFHLLDPVPLSAGREFHKIVARFYSAFSDPNLLLTEKRRNEL